uniref:Uncharacterized protein n=1 Tax=Oryza brachyantha TaxID=4533 RepID=J3LUA0_ORYBR
MFVNCYHDGIIMISKNPIILGGSRRAANIKRLTKCSKLNQPAYWSHNGRETSNAAFIQNRCRGNGNAVLRWGGYGSTINNCNTKD